MVIGVIIIEARLIINVNIDARGRGINVLRLRVDFFSCNEVSMIYHKESCRTIEKKIWNQYKKSHLFHTHALSKL